MSLLDDRPDAFRERNLFFWAALGLLSSGERLDGLLDRHGDTPPETPDLDDPTLLAILGLVALKEAAQAHLLDAAQAPPDAPAPEAGLPLRDLFVDRSESMSAQLATFSSACPDVTMR